jgi:hypothetical protein
MVKGARLPDLCVKCGEPGTNRMKRTFARWFQRTEVTLRLCDRHRKQRVALIASGVGFFGIALTVAVVLVSAVGPQNPDAQARMFTGVAQFMGGLLALVGTASWATGGVRAARITQSFVWLKGVHENVLHQVPLWPGETAAFAEVSAAGAFQAEPPLPQPGALANAALVLGCLSIFLLPAPVAIVVGMLAIVDVWSKPGRTGLGRSVFGLTAGLIGTVVLAVAVVSGGSTSAPKPSASAGPPPPPPTVAIASQDGAMHIAAPLGWRSETDLNKIAQLQTCDRAQQSCLVVIREARTDPAITLERFARVASGLVLKNLEGGIDSGPVALKIDGRDALQYELRGVIKQTHLVYLHTSLMSQAHYYQVIGWTSPELFPRQKAVLSDITSSFHAGETP